MLYFYYFKNPVFLNFPESLLLGFVPVAFVKHPYLVYLPHLLNLAFLILFLQRFSFTFWLFLVVLSPVEQGLVLLFLNFFLFLEKNFYFRKLNGFFVGFIISFLYPLCGFSFFVFQIFRFCPKKKRHTFLGALIALLFWFSYLFVKQKFSFSVIFSYFFREELFPKSASLILENPFIFLWIFFAIFWFIEVFKVTTKQKLFYFFIAFSGILLFSLSRANNPLWPVLFFVILFLKSFKNYKTVYPLLGIFFWLPVFFKKEIRPYPENISAPMVISLENPYQKTELLILRNQNSQIYLLDLYIVPEQVQLALNGFGKKTKIYFFSKAMRSFLEKEREYAGQLEKKLLQEKNLYFVYAGSHEKEDKPYRRIQEIRQKFTQAKFLFVSLKEF